MTHEDTTLELFLVGASSDVQPSSLIDEGAQRSIRQFVDHGNSEDTEG